MIGYVIVRGALLCMEGCALNSSRYAKTQLRLLLWRLALAAGLLMVLPGVSHPALAGSPAPIVFGTDLDAATYSGNWLRRIYVEAFRRLGVPLEFAVFPTRRLSAELDQGHVDGEPVRVYGYADTHPNLVRVEESALDVVFALYTTNPELRLNRLEDLAGTGWIGEYRRGVAFCETILKQRLPAARLSDVAATDQGLRKLLAQRTDFYCDIDNMVLTALALPEFKGVTRVRRLLDLGSPLPLYPYLHKKHAALAPRLAAALKQMKAEGLIERYRVDAEREFGIAR